MELEVASLRLPDRHRAALRWFADMTGQITPWPEPLPVVGPLASRPKGIYKPEWSSYALSIRETLDGPYPDREPIAAGESWLYAYHQEGPGSEAPTERWMNAALHRCMVDGVPVGVLREIPSQRSRKLYEVLGLAIPIHYDSGFFFLEGTETRRLRLPTQTHEDKRTWPTDMPTLATSAGLSYETVRRMARPQHANFRKALITAYRGTCSATSYDAVAALQAAHIAPFHESGSDAVSNGILLRSDVHLLFDSHLLRIHPDTFTLHVAPELRSTRYAALDSTTLKLPLEAEFMPDRELLALHADRCPW